MKKRIFSLALALVLALALCVPALALVDKSAEFYVADYAGVLSGGTKNEIISTNAALEDFTGGQIVVVTVDYLDGLYADEYAVRLFNDWGVGDKDKNNGVLLLLAVQENKAWLTQGAGITSSLSDDTISSLLNYYFWKPFDSGDYDGAVKALFGALVKWYEGFYNIEIASGGVATWDGYSDGYTVYTPSDPYGGYVTVERGFSFFDLFSSLITIVFVIIIVVVLISFFSSSGRATRRRYVYRPPIVPPIIPPPIMRGPRVTPPPPRNNNNKRGGGGFWGGGFGGGFGGFTGGGGHSGGGGFGGGGFGGGMGHGGGGFSGGGGGGRR